MSKFIDAINHLDVDTFNLQLDNMSDKEIADELFIVSTLFFDANDKTTPVLGSDNLLRAIEKAHDTKKFEECLQILQSLKSRHYSFAPLGHKLIKAAFVGTNKNSPEHMAFKTKLNEMLDGHDFDKVIESYITELETKREEAKSYPPEHRWLVQHAQELIDQVEPFAMLRRESKAAKQKGTTPTSLKWQTAKAVPDHERSGLDQIDEVIEAAQPFKKKPKK